MIGADFPDWGMTEYHRRENAAQKAERNEWQQAIIDSDKAELKGIAEEIYKDFAFADGEEYYRQHGIDCEESDWHEWILEESTARIKRSVLFKSAQQRAINDMAEAMADALENGDDWTTLSWVVAKIKADDERDAKSAEAFDKMMCA